MMNIILLFFIFVISSNVKVAIFHDVNNNSPKTIGYISVAHPTAIFTNYKEEYTPYLDAINGVLSYESENTKYAFQGEPNDVKLKNRAKKNFESLIQNSNMKMKGHFIKITLDNENKRLAHNVSLYFNININKNNANDTYNFELHKPEVAELVVKPLRKRNFIVINLLMLPEFKNFIKINF
ncbi:hypothetical protein YYG_01909 [Plasmodium vinckei petteri]|uniref:Fam-a protein n=1 Tax=Plasmodium vinckei petteri TaxID=138298 RepID=W7AWC8_PLAVN|nr:hypothetical protein YYG_01909 [Plasmodium vinckei petteri]